MGTTNGGPLRAPDTSVVFSPDTATVAVGETITIDYSSGAATPSSSTLDTLFGGIATSEVTGGIVGTISISGVSVGSVTIAPWTSLGNGAMMGQYGFTLTVTAPAEDESYLNKRGLAHFWDNIDSLKLDTNGTAYRGASIPFGIVDGTSTSTAFTATVPGITELRDGVCMWLKNGTVTSAAGFTIDINGLGAKPVYSNMAAATAESTMFNINYTFMFVYDSTRVAGGCWMLNRGYNSNDNTIGYQIRTNNQSLEASDKFVRYRLLFTSADGTKYVPANTSTSTNATASRTVNQTKINPFGRIFYYSSTTAIAQGSRPGVGVLWEQYAIVLGYSFNRTGAALTLTSWKPVYIKCAPQADGSAIIDDTTPYVQDLPSTEDGKIYIFLGIAYDATHVELQLDHPVYYYKGGAIRPWADPAIDSALDANSTNPVQNSVITTAIGNVETILQTLNNGGGAQ